MTDIADALLAASVGDWIAYSIRGAGPMAAAVREVLPDGLRLDTGHAVGFDGGMRGGRALSVHPTRREAQDAVIAERRARRAADADAKRARLEAEEVRRTKAAIVRRLGGLSLDRLRDLAAAVGAEVVPDGESAEVEIALDLLRGGCSPSDIGRACGVRVDPAERGTVLIRTLRRRGYSVAHEGYGRWRLQGAA